MGGSTPATRAPSIADGFLFLSGRIKELINQGGEKIAPREVDEALLSHPAVAEAASFAMPDAMLGEAVAAAVVLRPGHRASQAELRAHVATRLALFKAPRRIVVVAALPISATGKVSAPGADSAAGATRLGTDPSSDAARRQRTRAHPHLGEAPEQAPVTSPRGDRSVSSGRCSAERWRLSASLECNVNEAAC